MFYADDERIILVCEALLELSIREPLNIVETGKQFMADVLFFFPWCGCNIYGWVIKWQEGFIIIIIIIMQYERAAVLDLLRGAK